MVSQAMAGRVFGRKYRLDGVSGLPKASLDRVKIRPGSRHGQALVGHFQVCVRQ
jgi:hypothetical protein